MSRVFKSIAGMPAIQGMRADRLAGSSPPQANTLAGGHPLEIGRASGVARFGPRDMRGCHTSVRKAQASAEIHWVERRNLLVTSLARFSSMVIFKIGV